MCDANVPISTWQGALNWSLEVEVEPGGWSGLVAGLGVGCPGPGRVGPGPDICTAQLVQPPPAAPKLHQPHYRLQIDLMVWWRWTDLQTLSETPAMNTVSHGPKCGQILD